MGLWLLVSTTLPSISCGELSSWGPAMNQIDDSTSSPALVPLIANWPLITLPATKPPYRLWLDTTLPSMVALWMVRADTLLATMPCTVPEMPSEPDPLPIAAPPMTQPLSSNALAWLPTSRLPPAVPDDARSSDPAVSTVTLPRTVAPVSSQNWSGGTTTLSYVPL